ncbi:hypothetical protein [Chryseobacterium aquifrigidense]|uniref:Uncharacterized protein n=1 Tax=Chryseobacterium aquifrigidense TaxID=558021 RepID=A0A543E9V6_9FLAO|nr:hypothetical protein [Chryseobacterium aquifrigidense]TQM18358.1 hypothetical protein FB551_4139 [Chryseobacterium aquifrigidense]
MHNKINEKEHRAKINNLLGKIDSGQGHPLEISIMTKEVIKLESELQDLKLEFRKKVIELLPGESPSEIYKITQTLPLEYQEEYFLLLSEGVSFDSAFQQLKIKYNF